MLLITTALLGLAYASSWEASDPMGWDKLTTITVQQISPEKLAQELQDVTIMVGNARQALTDTKYTPQAIQQIHKILTFREQQRDIIQAEINRRATAN